MTDPTERAVQGGPYTSADIRKLGETRTPCAIRLASMLRDEVRAGDFIDTLTEVANALDASSRKAARP